MDPKTLEKALEKVLEPIKKGLASVKEDLASVKQDVASVKQDVASVKKDLAAVKEDVAEVKQDVAEVKQDVAAVKDTLDNRVLPSIIETEITLKSYADRYKINKHNIERVDTRLTTVEEHLDIEPPEELKVPHFSAK